MCFLAVGLKSRFGYDDSLDVVGVHMVGGMLGVLLTGVFASLAINPAGAAASLAQVGKQARAGRRHGGLLVRGHAGHPEGHRRRRSELRVTEEDEDAGLDPSQHGEVGYRL